MAILYNRVADQLTRGAVSSKLALEQDRLPCGAVADEAPQAHVRNARDDPPLSRGQGEEAAALGQDVVHRQQQLTPTDNRERLDGGDPGPLARRCDLVAP